VCARRPDLWTDAFLAALERTGGQVRVAADLAGIHHTQVYRRLKRSTEFRARVDAVLVRLRDARTERAALRSTR
jgi:DNA-binding NtrC family response regulator